MKLERRSKQGQIAALLRKRIVGGEFQPGDMLPSRLQLASELDVSMVTLQRAFDRLADDGFISAKGGHGTYVTQRPPHLSQYGLVFFSHPQDSFRWGRFAQALMNEASVIERGGERTVPCYFEVDGRDDGEDFQKLVRDTVHHRLAGLIFTSNPLHLDGTPLLDEPNVPRVAITSQTSGVSFPAVMPDNVSFFDRAIDHLAERGRRNIAVLLKAGAYDHSDYRDALLRAVARRGLVHKPHWRQFVDVFDQDSIRHATQVLVHREQSPRPDALIIGDDTMLESAVAGLIAAGVGVPDEIEVVAHCNFPWSAASPMPLKRLGFDARRILAACIESIDRQRQGLDVPRGIMISAQFDHEV